MVHHYPALNRPLQPVCSVCIANYNGVDLLADCIDSILAQSGGIEVEILVHDDASTDDSVAWLRARYPQVELLASAENVGFCVGNNRMAAHARGEFLLLFNNDAALAPDALDTLLALARSTPQGAVLTLPQYDWASGELVDRGCLLDPFYNPVPNLDPLKLEVAMTIGACLWVPHNLWRQLGGFPEWLESIGEDLYLCCQARLQGVSVRCAARSGYRHRQGHSFGGNRVNHGAISTTYRRRRLSERNKTFALFVLTPNGWMGVLLAVHLLLLLTEGLILSLLRGDRRLFVEVYANVPVQLVMTWSQLREVRAREQRQRKSTARLFFREFTALPRKISMLRRYGLPKLK